MKTLTKICIAGLSIVYLSGCGGGAVNSTSDLPDWYLKPQASTPTFYYGSGDGASKEDAKAKALANVAGLISSTVSSSMDITSTDSTETGFSENSKSNIKSSTDAIRFTGVTELKNEMISGKYYVNLTVDRDTLFKSQKVLIDDEYSEATALLKRMESKGAFEVLKSSSRLQDSIDNILKKPSLAILKSIKPSFNTKSYRAKVMDVSSDLDSAKRAISITLSSKDALSARYKGIVEKYISSSGITIVNSASQVSNRDNLLAVEVAVTAKKKAVKSKDPRLKGASFAAVTIVITTKDSKKRVVAQNRINVTNISKEGLKAAKIKTKKFEKEISRKGIYNILVKASR